MKPVAFDYLRADSIEEVLNALAEYETDAVLLAGGMSLGPMLNMRLVRPSVLIDLNHVRDLDKTRISDNEIMTGATARQADILINQDVAVGTPLLTKALGFVGHFQTRNRGTMGGSVAHADPGAEIPLALVTLGGEIDLSSKRNRTRRIEADNFFCGVLTTERRPDEMLTSLHWPRQAPKTGYAFEEVSQRPGDLAIAAVACAAKVGVDGRVEELDLGIGGVEDRPFRLDTEVVIGEQADDPTIQALSDQAFDTVNPTEDLTAGAEYRKALVRTLTVKAVKNAFADAAEKASNDG